jgi:hypothetical protein
MKQASAWYSENLKNAVLENKLTFIASNQKNEYPDEAEVISLVSYK